MTASLRIATDEELAARVAADGSEEASAELFRRYSQKIYLWCFNYIHDVDEAVDCTQEIFIRIFRAIGGFAGRSRFSTWVYRIARNHCLSELARHGARWRQRVDITEVDLEDPRCTASLREAELAGQLERLLTAASERMKPDELEAFVLHYREGLTIKEITNVLDCANVTGARTLIQNARRKFQRFVTKEEYRDG